MSERVEYLRFLTAEFNRIWPSGHVRSSEPTERMSFVAQRDRITKLKGEVEADLDADLGNRYNVTALLKAVAALTRKTHPDSDAVELVFEEGALADQLRAMIEAAK